MNSRLKYTRKSCHSIGDVPQFYSKAERTCSTLSSRTERIFDESRDADETTIRGHSRATLLSMNLSHDSGVDGQFSDNHSDSDDGKDIFSAKPSYDITLSDVRFSHLVYEQASQIFEFLCGGHALDELPSCSNDLQKRRVFSLAFATHRYRGVLTDVLLDSNFYLYYNQFREHFDSQVKILLLDFYNHGYRFSGNKRVLLVQDTESHIPHIFEIQNAMLKVKVKISSAFARNRIKACTLNLEGFLPDIVQERKSLSTHQPLYVRMDCEKMDYNSIIAGLVEEGFDLCTDCDLVSLQGREFTRDPTFTNMLVFSKDCRDEVYSLMFTNYGILVPQDKSKSFIAETGHWIFSDAAKQREKANSLISQDGQMLIQEQDDALFAYPDSGAILSHFAAVMEPGRRLFVCGCSKQRKSELGKQVVKLPVHSVNIELLEEDFVGLNLNEERFRKVKVIVCNVPCSKSGIVNLEDFVLQESTEYLRQVVDHVGVGKLQSLISDELMALRYSLKFPQVNSVIYFTNSTNKDENESLVLKVMREYLLETSSKNPFELQPLLPELVMKFREYLQEQTSRHHLKPYLFNEGEKFLKIPPTNIMNGFFVALMKRKYLDASPKEMIERAAKNARSKNGKGSKKKKKKKKSSKTGALVDTTGLSIGDEEFYEAYLITAEANGEGGAEHIGDSGIAMDPSKEDYHKYDDHSRKIVKTKKKLKKKKKKKSTEAHEEEPE